DLSWGLRWERVEGRGDSREIESTVKEEGLEVGLVGGEGGDETEVLRDGVPEGECRVAESPPTNSGASKAGDMKHAGNQGVFHITIFAFNQFYNKTDELGAYFVQMVPEGLLLTMNSSVIHKNEVILFSAKLDRGTDVTYSWNLGDQTSYVHEGKNAVSIYTKQIIYATNSDIYFTAVTAESSPLQFLWYFGNKAPIKTTARSISTRYSRPGRYNVIVNASNQISSFTSDIYPVELQQRVEPNRLRLNNMGLVSVLLNSSVTLEARINYGTNLSYLWDFGDGTVRSGHRTESHSYNREGEFTTRVDIFNNVSSATLSGHLFVISEMCEPPSVKNYGPSKFQIRRYQSFKLGVTFENEIVCNISRGVHYHWSFFGPDGSLVALPKVDSSKQSILIPGYLLDYGIYLGIARVQIVGSVVYNNYTVSVEVLATPPVSVISGGTHLFVADKNDSVIDLKGSESFDPDYPDTTRMKFSWLCEAVSALYIPCFKPDVSNPLNISSSIVNVPMSALKSDIDQFVFKLMVNNNDRYSPEAQMRVKLFCPKCLNSSVNWNDDFSIRAVCEDCPETLSLSYSWKLYLVNATETEHFERLSSAFFPTGIKSQTLTFKPFSLQSKNVYMLEVTVAGEEKQSGKAQLFFSTTETPQGITCEVRPSIGLEIETQFSIFCTSGRKDLFFEYSYSVGNSTEILLHEGMDHEYYFNLPAGDKDDGYKLTINTVITNLFGSKTKPCSVIPTVLPSINKSLKNLSALTLLGNQRETKNYLLLLTRILNRLHKEGDNRQDFQTQTRNELIVALCSLNVTNQVCLVKMAKLFKVALFSSINYFFAVEVMAKCNNFLVIFPVFQRYVLITNQSQFYVNTNFMELQITQHYGSQSAGQSTGSTGVYLPDDLGRQISEKTGQNNSCFITHLISFKHNPYFWGTSPVQVNGDVADLTMYNCTTRRKVDVRGLQTPVIIEFERNDDRVSKGQLSVYSLLRTQMNVHMFLVTPENQQQALQIEMNLTEAHEQAFPIMLLMRFNKEPTPSQCNLKQIYHWNGNTIHVFIPAGSLMDTGNYYLGLLDADYDRKPQNHYLAKNVSYTLSLLWTQCLYWDDIREWKSNGCSPQKKSDSQKINCRKLFFCWVEQNSAFENYAPCIIVLFTVILYLLLVIVCKRMDLNIETKPGIIVLQDNAPTNQHLYEITTETGFRPRAGTTAKVHINLHGENGVSETRELYHSEKQLFERNSRHKFIMSVPESLGPIWKVYLWHDNGGHSPSWYLSSVVVKDLMTGTSWFFPAECWLALDKGDGKIQRELIPLNHGPGFKKLLYSKLTEYLEDFHLWGSVYSRPSYSSCTHTQRLTVCLCLLLSYMCLNALGLIDVSTVSLVTGLITNIAVLPFVVLVSLLFRFSKVSSCIVASFLISVVQTNSNQYMINDLPSMCLHIRLKFRGKILQKNNPSSLIEQPVAIGNVVAIRLVIYRFGPTKCILWLHSLLFSLLYCFFVIQPTTVSCMKLTQDTKVHRNVILNTASPLITMVTTPFPFGRCPTPLYAQLAAIVAARQRARYLRLARPPTSAQLKEAKDRMRKETLIQQTLREFVLYLLMLVLLLLIIFGKLSNDEYYLNQAIRAEFTGYETLDCFCTHFMSTGEGISFKIALYKCKLLYCTFRHEAYATLIHLKENEWIDRNTRVAVVEFTLYNPPTNLFTAVSLLAEMPQSGGVLPSISIESVSVYHINSTLDYFIMVFELLFLAIILLHFYLQTCRISQKGLLRYCQESWNWLEVRNLL
uniref:Polycystin-1-like protein 1 n=1 Tax=Callorhinchus milii TaxID=7868 RepID=A0A4W3JXY9_CALMI